MHYHDLEWMDTFLSTWLYLREKPYGLIGQTIIGQLLLLAAVYV